jgi:hypothetical protein
VKTESLLLAQILGLKPINTLIAGLQIFKFTCNNFYNVHIKKKIIFMLYLVENCYKNLSLQVLSILGKNFRPDLAKINPVAGKEI